MFRLSLIGFHSYLTEHLQSEFNKDVKTDQSILGLKDKIVTCEHCTKDFGCKKCMSKINHIRRLNQGLKMKDLTIQSEYLYVIVTSFISEHNFRKEVKDVMKQ